MGWIYVATSPSGRSYVGQTVRPPWQRLREHCYPASRHKCTAFEKAIQKYGGWDPKRKTLRNFTVQWYECPDRDMNKLESALIQRLGTLSPNGYNLQRGTA